MTWAAGIWRALWPVLVALLALGFAAYSAGFGWAGLSGQRFAETYLFRAAEPVANTGIGLHMITGAVITVLAPLQLIGAVRDRWPAVHRWSGRLLAALAVLTAIGGLIYIGQRGTIGGPIMSFAFALYGALLLLSAVQAVRFARARRFVRHRAWALRFFVLAIGSWIYRVQYGLWYALTGGLGSNDALTGPFDRIQVFAFFLPYLALVELWVRRRPMAPDAPET